MNIPDVSRLYGILENTDFILALPQKDTRINMKIQDTFNKKLGGRNGLVIKGEEAEELLTLYSLYAFTDKLIIGSFDHPCGRKLRNLLDSGVATENEIINDVILGAMDGASI